VTAPPRRGLHRAAARVLSVAMIVIGIVLLVVTLSRGGGAFAIGVVMGVLFVAAGASRLYIERGERA
jgi:multisubunit Na+/H+ antiporter MnhB subunit